MIFVTPLQRLELICQSLRGREYVTVADLQGEIEKALSAILAELKAHRKELT